MPYIHPLAYLLGIEGAALLQAFRGEHDREFTDARLADIRRLLDDERLAGEGVTVERVDSPVGYGAWSKTYDSEDNGLFPFEEPTVKEIIDPLRTGVALDAACGTGRYADYLASREHRVIGVDSSSDMLDHARARVPHADFRLGELTRLPVGDAEVDLVVCALALTHTPDLAPVFAEFARVLRPGGHLVVSDIHDERVSHGVVPKVRGPAGEPQMLSVYLHPLGDYLRAALPVGFEVRRCEEPRLPAGPPAQQATPIAADAGPGAWDGWPYSLADLIPEASHAVAAGSPVAVIWHFQLARSVRR